MGASKTKKNLKNTRVLLPKLKKVTNKNKKYHYKLKNPSEMREKAIDEGIMYEYKNMGKTKKQAATAKKGRFNILRIYRRNKKVDECRKITRDMRYIDKKYKLGKTKNICGKKKKGKKTKKTKRKQKGGSNIAAFYKDEAALQTGRIVEGSSDDTSTLPTANLATSNSLVHVRLPNNQDEVPQLILAEEDVVRATPESCAGATESFIARNRVLSPVDIVNNIELQSRIEEADDWRNDPELAEIVERYTSRCGLCRQPLLERYPLRFLRENPNAVCPPAADMMENGWQHWRSNAIFQVGCSGNHRFHFGCLQNYLKRSSYARSTSDPYDCPVCQEPCIRYQASLLIDSFIGGERPDSSMGDHWPRSHWSIHEADGTAILNNEEPRTVSADYWYGKPKYLGEGMPTPEGESGDICAAGNCAITGGKGKTIKGKKSRKH
tara:strand:+ start:10884 stop:12191 length:1308 start_codon:yes stop_codon:yes gene_type:complete